MVNHKNLKDKASQESFHYEVSCGASFFTKFQLYIINKITKIHNKYRLTFNITSFNNYQ